MDAAMALNKQFEHYRQMTGEQRLNVALELHEMSCDITRDGIRRQNPGAESFSELERLLRLRLELARAACMSANFFCLHKFFTRSDLGLPYQLAFYLLFDNILLLCTFAAFSLTY